MGNTEHPARHRIRIVEPLVGWSTVVPWTSVSLFAVIRELVRAEMSTSTTVLRVQQYHVAKRQGFYTLHATCTLSTIRGQNTR